MRLQNQTVLITGAAGQLGRCFAQAFVKEGAKLWLADSSDEGLRGVVAKLPSGRVLGSLVFDVSNPQDVSEAFAEIKSNKGVVDVLINNAGIGVFTPFWERDYTDFLNVMSVNAGGTFLCTREALLMMKERGRGSIVNIGSIYGVVSSDPRIYTDCARMNSEVYSASKAAVIQLTKYFSVHAADFGVRVNCVSPGGVFNQQGDGFINNYSNRTPYGRMADESEMCGAVVFLASDESGYVSGQNIVVDGGFTAW